jgi:hypothetical protein
MKIPWYLLLKEDMAMSIGCIERLREERVLCDLITRMKKGLSIYLYNMVVAWRRGT